MKRNEGGYVPTAFTGVGQILGPPPSGGSALTRIECASCNAPRIELADLKRLAIAVVNSNNRQELYDTCMALEKYLESSRTR